MDNIDNSEIPSSEIPSTEVHETENLDARTFVEEVYEDPSMRPHISLMITSPEQMPAKNKSEFDPRFLEEIYPPEKSGESHNIAITAIHGNEPNIMTAATHMEINEIMKENGLKSTPIILPFYSENNLRILREEFPGTQDQIFYSKELGDILKKTEYSKAGYQAHLRELVAHQPEVYERLLDFLSRPYTAQSLATGEPREFSPNGRRLEINAGANVTAAEPGQKSTHFIFPVLLSEMMKATMDHLHDPQLKFDPVVLKQVFEIAQEFEDRYRSIQLPEDNTLSGLGDQFSRVGKDFTLPLKVPRPSPDLIIPEKKGIYIMGSGSEVGIEPLVDNARELSKQGYEILGPSWLGLDFGQTAIPDAIFHPNVVAVMGRHGWGIGWISQVAEKPFIAMPHLWYDNPEMYFNAITMEQTGLGVVFDGRSDIVERALLLQPGIVEHNNQIRQKHGLPHDANGIRQTAENIVRAEIKAIMQRLAA